MGVDAWALVIAIASVAWSIVVWFTARREARGAREDADRAVRAAEDSAAAAQRTAIAAERQVELATPPAISFGIMQTGRSSYSLVNTGTHPASGVSIAPDAFAGMARDLPSRVTLQPGQTHDFMVLTAAQVSVPSSVEVTCEELDGPRHVVLPPPY